MNKQRTVYIVSGPLGVGKTTVTRKLVSQLDEGVLIEGDTFLNATEKVSKLSWEKRISLAWNSILDTTRSYIKAELDVVIDVVIDFVIEEELRWFVEKTKDLNIKIKYIVLIADKKTLENRLEKRGEVQYLNRSIVLLNKLNNDPLNSEHVFDTTNINTSVIVTELLSNNSFIVH